MQEIEIDFRLLQIKNVRNTLLVAENQELREVIGSVSSIGEVRLNQIMLLPPTITRREKHNRNANRRPLAEWTAISLFGTAKKRDYNLVW